MTTHPAARVGVTGIALLIAANLIAALTATNWVPTSRASVSDRPIGPNDLKPPECAALDLTETVSGSVLVTGTSGNDLILGSAVIDTIDGLGGDDCILGGGGDDVISGGAGNDVCIGGPGLDAFTGCETEIQ